MVRMTGIDAHIDDEWYVVRYSGEIPEIALNASIYYLTRAKDGPHLTLREGDYESLRAAADERFREIVLRDLQHENRELPIYRGVKRSITNYDRYRKFCVRHGLGDTGFGGEVAGQLQKFLAEEISDVEKDKRPSVLNCTHGELLRFAADLGIDPTGLPTQLQDYCPITP